MHWRNCSFTPCIGLALPPSLRTLPIGQLLIPQSTQAARIVLRLQILLQPQDARKPSHWLHIVTCHDPIFAGLPRSAFQASVFQKRRLCVSRVRLAAKRFPLPWHITAAIGSHHLSGTRRTGSSRSLHAERRQTRRNRTSQPWSARRTRNKIAQRRQSRPIREARIHQAMICSHHVTTRTPRFASMRIQSRSSRLVLRHRIQSDHFTTPSPPSTHGAAINTVSQSKQPAQYNKPPPAHAPPSAS
jgi:hypothetical protein